MNRTAAFLVASLAVATVSAGPALAAPKKITKTYTASAPNPDPTNSASDYSVCAQNVPGSFDTKVFAVPAAGKLLITLSGFVGDWDLLLTDAANVEIGKSGHNPGEDEAITMKFKKAQKVSITACNWAGGSTGTVSYTFTYA